MSSRELEVPQSAAGCQVPTTGRLWDDQGRRRRGGFAGFLGEKAAQEIQVPPAAFAAIVVIQLQPLEEHQQAQHVRIASGGYSGSFRFLFAVVGEARLHQVRDIRGDRV